MTKDIKLNIDISRINDLTLIEKSNIDAQANRNKYIEQARIAKAKKLAKKLNENDKRIGTVLSTSGLQVKRKEEPGYISRAKFRKEELGASRFGKTFLFGHSINNTTYTKSIQETLLAYAVTNTSSRIEKQPFAIYNSFGWTIRSGDWNEELSFVDSISSPALPQPSWDVTFEQRTAQVRRVVVYRLLVRFGTTFGVPFRQDLAVYYDVYLDSYEIGLTPDIIEQAGGYAPPYDEQVDPSSLAPPPPQSPYDYTEMFYEEISSTETYVTVNITGVFNYNWNATAVILYTSTPQMQWFILPAGGDACIFIAMYKYHHLYMVSDFTGIVSNVSNDYDPPRLSTGYPPPDPSILSARTLAVNKAYVVNNSSLREINIPPKLAEAINILSPPFETSQEFGITVPSNTGIFTPGNQSEYFDSNIATTWSPSIYEDLNELANFTDPSNIASVYSTRYPVVGDSRFGFYAGESLDRGLYYANWLGDPENIDLNQVSKFRELRSKYVSVPENAYTLMPGYTLNAVWDWGNPAYCRLMLSELGFQEEDLIP